MLKKTITYTDFNENTRTEDFYFNLNKVELTELQTSVPGGLANRAKELISEKNEKVIFEMFRDLILKSYGEKSSDGKRFVKSPELRENFSQTPAFDVIFEEIAATEESATAFVNGIISGISKSK